VPLVRRTVRARRSLIPCRLINDIQVAHKHTRIPTPAHRHAR
jgi:hypothetical protein